MGTYDVVMLALFALAVMFGLWKGFAWQVASLTAIVVSYLVALRFSEPLAAMIKTDPPWNRFIAMLGLFLVTSLGVWIAFGYVRATIERWRLKDFDRQAGALLGAVKGALICGVVTIFAVMWSEPVRAAVIQSWSGNLICRTINQWSAAVPGELRDVLGPLLERFNEKLNEPLPPDLQTDGRTEWSAHPRLNTQPLPPRTASSEQMLNAANFQQRADQVLRALDRFARHWPR